jgi:hypothetical protein
MIARSTAGGFEPKMLPSIQAVYACANLLNKVMLTEGGGVRLGRAA